MKKKLAVLLVVGMSAAVCACGQPTASQETATESVEAVEETFGETTDQAVVHSIGVMVYNRTDDEVLDRKKYLEQYIEECFDVDFIYSEAISTEEDALSFIQNAADAGVEGIISFNSRNLEKEVALCEDNEVYYMMGAETIEADLFEAVADNPWFLGVVGPGEETEYLAGIEMAEFFIDQSFGNSYYIMTGGSGLGNEMHLQRTLGILYTFQEKMGQSFDQSIEEIALNPEIQYLQLGEAELCIVPGYVQIPDVQEKALEAFKAADYQSVLSVYNGSVMADELKDVHVGIVDCYSENNMNYFNSGALDYVTGKYGSIVGPSFAAMYNAITGHADMLREEDGKAFQMTNGFWTSSNRDDFEKKYMVAESVEIQAYNYEDLQKVCVEYNKDASLDDLKALAQAYSYEDVCARRGIE